MLVDEMRLAQIVDRQPRPRQAGWIDEKAASMRGYHRGPGGQEGPGRGATPARPAERPSCKNIRLSSDVANPVEQEPTLAGG